jgi:hypothetical protein
VIVARVVVNGSCSFIIVGSKLENR